MSLFEYKEDEKNSYDWIEFSFTQMEQYVRNIYKITLTTNILTHSLKPFVNNKLVYTSCAQCDGFINNIVGCCTIVVILYVKKKHVQTH